MKNPTKVLITRICIIILNPMRYPTTMDNENSKLMEKVAEIEKIGKKIRGVRFVSRKISFLWIVNNETVT